MTPQEELNAALAELAAAKAELDAATVEVAAAAKPAPRKRVQKPKRRERRPVHHTDLRAECSGSGERFTGAEKVRVDMQPIVMKDVSPIGRPTDYTYEGKECLFEYDIRNGIMQSDSWKRCKCYGCAEIRRG